MSKEGLNKSILDLSDPRQPGACPGWLTLSSIAEAIDREQPILGLRN